MVTTPPEGMLQGRWLLWKVGLYNSEMISSWGCNFWMGELVYNIFPISHSTPLLILLQIVDFCSKLHSQETHATSIYCS